MLEQLEAHPVPVCICHRSIFLYTYRVYIKESSGGSGLVSSSQHSNADHDEADPYSDSHLCHLQPRQEYQSGNLDYVVTYISKHIKFQDELAETFNQFSSAAGALVCRTCKDQQCSGVDSRLCSTETMCITATILGNSVFVHL